MIEIITLRSKKVKKLAEVARPVKMSTLVTKPKGLVKDWQASLHRRDIRTPSLPSPASHTPSVPSMAFNESYSDPEFDDSKTSALGLIARVQAGNSHLRHIATPVSRVFS